FILAVVVLIISNRIEMGDNYLFAIPFSVIVLFLYSFFFDALVLPIYMILLTPLLIIASRGVEIYLINMFAGGAAFYTFRIWNRGWLQFLNTIVIFVVLSLGYSSLRLIEGGALSSIDTALFIYFGWNAILVIAAYPLLFLFEKLFGLLSYSRLRDLSDPTTKLLSRLAKEAPGTFHHSLQVANLAESAAAEIGANPILARVGALYHDIGKLSNPLYFVENMRLGEGREDPHASLSYQKSAAIILSHIPDGIRLAEKRRVPRLVQGFILSHHGTTQSRYFYNLYLNEGGDPSAVESFSYKGRVPYSKEEAIVMIADTVEAASRTLKDFLPETIERFVNEMVEQKINEGQFIKSSITLSELEIVKGVMKEKLAQYHHNRIEYPSITEELES
ncbi:MAG: HDIG domain-containing metalloprotein, partial [Bacteroidales bacterium]